MTIGSSDGPIVLPTLTHARVRVAQGDPPGARRILEEILAKRPHDTEARNLLEQIRSDRGRPHRVEPAEEPLEAPSPWSPPKRGGRGGAVVRLSDYLARIQRTRDRDPSR